MVAIYQNSPVYGFNDSALSGYLVEVFSGPSWLSLSGADSLSRSVHCAPDENDTGAPNENIAQTT